MNSLRTFLLGPDIKPVQDCYKGMSMLYAFSACRLHRAVRPYLPDQVLLAARTAGQLGTDAASFPFARWQCLHSIAMPIH